MKIEDIKEIIDNHKAWAENENNFEYDYQYKQELKLAEAITELYNKYIDLLKYSEYYYSGTNFAGTYNSINNTLCINEPKSSGSPIFDQMKFTLLKLGEVNKNGNIIPINTNIYDSQIPESWMDNLAKQIQDLTYRDRELFKKVLINNLNKY